MFDNSLIKRSGQFWKLSVSLALSIAGGITIFVALTNVDRLVAAAFTLIAVSGVALGVGGLVAGCLLVKCPQCGEKLLLMSIKGKSVVDWLPLWVRSEKRRKMSMSRKTEFNIIAEGAASSPQAVST